MKVAALVIATSILTSVSLAVFIYMKKADEVSINKKAAFMDIKVRVTRDVLGEYQSDAEKLQKNLEAGTKEVEALNTALKAAETEAKEKKTELENCLGNMKKMNEEIAANEKEKKNIQDQFQKLKATWTKEIDGLKKELGKRRKVCDFVKSDSVEGKKLCGDPLPAPPKPEAAKPAEAVPEAPKPQPESR
ncbi:hypothetical protein AGOR_G00209180 [Albula goreensis]|uniref:Uncharacterized protein n=1 Tax=Albula goreensis TaxID=1534307 RepID=A0A8T3CTJ3_9TELE|nr:hypothetical protein AGOR_G00209180 [Albula goreensis]